MEKTKREEIYDLFKQRACTKQDVYHVTKEIFAQFKEVLQEIVKEYKEKLGKKDSRVKIEYKSDNDFQAHITFGGDVLFFHMHSNVFSFDPEHHIWKSSYVKEDSTRAYCGMINIYNFLSDSLKYNRMNDAGYLIMRCFFNKEKHYFADGKKELNYLFNDLVNNEITKKDITEIVETALRYAIKFELQTPPYNVMETISIAQINELSKSRHLSTAKRLGFKIENEE